MTENPYQAPAWVDPLDSKDLYRSLCIGYGIRMATSICFPIGAVVDMFPGIAASVLFLTYIHSDNLSQQVTGIVATTLTQGILLNVILAAFIAFIYALFVLAKSDLFQSSRTRFRR